MKASDYLARYLEHRKVTHVFEMVGGMITHLLDSISQRKAIRIVSVHHEQAAAFAADAYGRITGVPGVAMATSGPGATNLLTGIGSCYFDSSPTVFITGQVNRHEMKGARNIRQLGFQETDIVAMAQPITKAAWQVTDPKQLPEMLAKAFDLAIAGRPGPVLLDIPMDVQRADIPAELIDLPIETRHSDVEDATIQLLLKSLRSASAPLLLVGGGMRSARAVDSFRNILGRLRLPVVHSLMGVDILPTGHPSRVGLIGSYGNRWANLAIGQSDVLLVLGSRLDVRQTGADVDSFKKGRQIFHIDCESGEMNNRVKDCIAIQSGLDEFLAILDRHLTHPINAPSAWVKEIQALREKWPDTAELPTCVGINPNRFMHALSRSASATAGYVVDVGQHQMWAAQSLDIGPNQRFLTSGGMGSMGFALPAAIGAAMADSPRALTVIAGDGGFQCNIHELQTVVRNRIPLKIVVLDNGCHGMVRQFQESYFEGRYQSTLDGYDAPDFTKVAIAYGISARQIATENEISDGLSWLTKDASEPALLHVKLDTMTNAYPKLAFGRPITDMEPFFTPQGMEGT